MEHIVDDTLPTLYCNLNSIHELWTEYKSGIIGNRKAVKDWTIRDRDVCKYTYHRRKLVWDQIVKIVWSGLNATEAMHIMYTVYDYNTSVTSIINQTRVDRKNRGICALGL